MQGPETAAEVNVVLKREKLEDDFPLFTAVHRSYCTVTKANKNEALHWKIAVLGSFRDPDPHLDL
jgi:hypothetical protein